MHSKTLFDMSENELIKLVCSGRTVCSVFGPLLEGAKAEIGFTKLATADITVLVPREALGLKPGIPGDIDVLIIPKIGRKRLFEQSIAVEVKATRPTLRNPGRSPNTFGSSQANGLADDGFRYVGLLHLCTPEPAPRQYLQRIRHIETGRKAETEKAFLVDWFPFNAAMRHHGRLHKLSLYDCVGFYTVGLSRLPEYPESLGFSAPILHRPKQCRPNAKFMAQLADSIGKYFKEHRKRFLSTVW